MTTTARSPREILEARRAAQISGSGLSVEDAQELARQCQPATEDVPETPRVPLRPLKFGEHVKRRMAQRGVTVRHVVLVRRFGEPVPAGASETAYTMTRTAVRLAPPRLHEELRPLIGVKVLVRFSSGDPFVVTVLRRGRFGGEG